MRVEKCDLAPEEPSTRTLIDELRPRGREAGKLGADIVDLEGEVMHAGAPFGEELPDGGVRTVRREQLDAAVSDAEERDVGPLVGNRLAMLDLRSEESAVRLDGLLEVVDGDADVMEAVYRHAGDGTGGGSRLGVQRAHDANGLGRTGLRLDVAEDLEQLVARERLLLEQRIRDAVE